MKKLIVEIKGFDYEGRGIGYYKNKKIHVYYAIPGDIVEVKILYKKRNEFFGIANKIIKQSNDRIKPICEYFSKCGGCRIQNIDYKKQLEFKENIVRELFGNCNEIIPSVDIFFYRNRMDFIIGKGYKIGLREVERFDKIVDIKKCYLQSEYSNNVINIVREFIKQKNLEPYDLISKKGFLRYLIIREGKNTGEKMINIVTKSGKFDQISELKSLLDYDCLVWSINDSVADVSTAEKYEIMDGNPFIREKVLDRIFYITPYSFFQTNTKTAEILYKKIMELSSLTGKERVLDLYCGSGAIGIFLSEYSREVIGVDISEESINVAMKNAEDIDNIKFLKARAEDIKNEDFDVIVVDPPRAGLSKKVIKNILEMKPKKIIYVSCNPRTQKSDIDLLKSYKIVEIQPIDMFPQTHHIENIVILERK